MDDKQSKFLDTAEVIRKIRTLKRCANTNTYDYTPQQVNQMFDAIDEAPPPPIMDGTLSLYGDTEIVKPHSN